MLFPRVGGVFRRDVRLFGEVGLVEAARDAYSQRASLRNRQREAPHPKTCVAPAAIAARAFSSQSFVYWSLLPHLRERHVNMIERKRKRLDRTHNIGTYITPSPSDPPAVEAQLYAQHRFSWSVSLASLYPVPFLQVFRFVEAAFVGEEAEPAEAEVLEDEAGC